MKAIKSLNLHKLPNAPHAIFFIEWLLPLLLACGETMKQLIAPLMAALNEWLEKEKANLEWVRRSAYTAQIADLDHRLDRAFAALAAQVRVLLYSTQDDVVAAAHRVNVLLRSFGRVTSKSYAAELGDILAVLNNLKDALAADVQLLGLTALVGELQAAYDAFTNAYRSRSEELAQKPAESFREVRQEVDAIYHQIVALVEANMPVATVPDYADFAAKLNPVVEQMNAQYATPPAPEGGESERVKE